MVYEGIRMKFVLHVFNAMNMSNACLDPEEEEEEEEAIAPNTQGLDKDLVKYVHIQGGLKFMFWLNFTDGSYFVFLNLELFSNISESNKKGELC